MALTGLLELVQHTLWHVLVGVGMLTGAGQQLLVRLSSANSIDITAAIWFHARQLPAWRTLGNAVLSVLVVGLGVSLKREGAPKQAGAVVANALSYARPSWLIPTVLWK